jgi:hypothetical protein
MACTPAFDAAQGALEIACSFVGANVRFASLRFVKSIHSTDRARQLNEQSNAFKKPVEAKTNQHWQALRVGAHELLKVGNRRLFFVQRAGGGSRRDGGGLCV